MRCTKGALLPLMPSHTGESLSRNQSHARDSLSVSFGMSDSRSICRVVTLAKECSPSYQREFNNLSHDPLDARFGSRLCGFFSSNRGTHKGKPFGDFGDIHSYNTLPLRGLSGNEP